MANIKDKVLQIRQAIFGKEVRSSIADGIEEINREVENTTAKQDNLESTFDQLVINAGSSNAEIVDARVDKTTGKSYTKVGERMDEFSSQLAESTKNVTYKHETIIPTVTFIDDDGHAEVYTKLLPIAQAKNVPMNCAIIPTWIGNVGRMTELQLQTVHNSGLFEFLGHGANYTANMLEFPIDVDLDNALYRDCKKWMEDKGYNVNGFVYPQGLSDSRVRLFTKKYYDFAFGGTGINGNSLLDTMNILRIPFGVYTGVGEDTLTYYKSQVDLAVTNKAWLVFMLHVGDQPEEQYAILEQLIDYIKSLNVPILKATDAHKIHGNKIFMGDVKDKNYFAVDKYGIPFGVGTTIKAVNTYNASNLIADFPNNSITVSAITGGNALLTPKSNVGGIFKTYKIHGNGWDYQEFKEYLTFDKYTRYTNLDGTWGEWRLFNAVDMRRNDDILSTTLISAFKVGITFNDIGTSNTTLSQFPEALPGICKTTKTNTSGVNAYQEYHVRNSFAIYKRYWDSGAVNWSAWKKVNINLEGSIAWNPINLANGVGETSLDITVTGAVLGDFAIVSAPFDLQGLTATAYVSASNIVKIRLYNGTGADLDLVGGTFRVKVIKQ